MYVIEISEDKYEGLSENVEKAIKYMGKVMQCVDAMKDSSREMEESEFQQRRGRSYRDSYDHDYRNWDEDRYGERMGRGSGRYSRY